MRVESARAWRLLAVLPLASGAALIVHVLAGISLGLALAAAVVVVAAAGIFLWAQLSPVDRAEVVRRAQAGVIAGIPATMVYDAARWVFVTVFHLTFWPFDIFSIFGQAIAGSGLPGGEILVIGVVYHYLNGLMFAVAYAILLGPRGWWTGVLWALGLEALMLSVYPGWLHPAAFGEFVSVSMLGHVAYGSTLGFITRRWLLYARGRAENGAHIS
jgi:hypothetical protein